MSGVNRVILLGRLGKDPESKTLESGATVCNFSIATSETFKDKSGEKKETTEWHNIVIWNKLADVATKYLNKGDQVYVEGKIQTRSWEKDGVTRYTTEILVNHMVMLGGKSNSEPSQNHKMQGAAATTSASPIDDDPTDDISF
jgi:single-strand DNA-binding protein